MIEIGKTYSFKTVTFYYIGTVTALYPSHARLENVLEVYETGANDSYYAGEIKSSEKMPDGTLVPLTGAVVITPYERVRVR